MQSLLALIGPLTTFGIGWLLCQEGAAAVRWQQARVRGTRVTGLWAQVVGVALLIIGVPLVVLSLAVALRILYEAVVGSA